MDSTAHKTSSAGNRAASDSTDGPRRWARVAAGLVASYAVAWSLNLYTTPWPPKPSHYIPEADMAYRKW